MIFAASCRHAGPPGAIDSQMASCIPAGATILAGFDLASVRASPLYAGLSATARAIIEPFHDASELLLASDGHDVLAIARGEFRQSPPGAMLVDSHLALAGPPALVSAAAAQHKTGKNGAPELTAHAESVAPGKQIWLVVPGDIGLPLSGDLVNVNRLMRGMEFAVISVKLGSQMELALDAQGRTPESAQRFEETLRATITLAASSEARQKDIAALLRSIRIERGGNSVHASLATGTDNALALLGLIAH
jgi:hypothetical protein